MLIFSLILLIICLYFLALVTDEYFLHSIDYISKKLKIHSDVAGATFMAAGSSAPELFIAIFALLLIGGHASIGIGTIVGSALFNMFIVIGISSLFNHAKLTWQTVIRDLIFYALSLVILMGSMWDQTITLWESIQLVAIYIVYVYVVFHWQKWIHYTYHDEFDPDIPAKGLRSLSIFDYGKKLLQYALPYQSQKRHMYRTFIISIALIGLCSFGLVESAVDISTSLGIPEGFVALTILAIGTSIPDLLSSFFVSQQGRGDMAISNAVGSNVFNVLFGLGLPWMITILITQSDVNLGINIDRMMTSVILLVIGVFGIIGVLIFNRWRLNKNVGIILIFVYFMYILYVSTRLVI